MQLKIAALILLLFVVIFILSITHHTYTNLFIIIIIILLLLFDCYLVARYKVVVDVPVQSAIFRILPKELRDGNDISTVAVLFTQGVNEQQSLADT